MMKIVRPGHFMIFKYGLLSQPTVMGVLTSCRVQLLGVSLDVLK